MEHTRRRWSLRIEQLEYFVDLAKTNSMNISAERLFIAQPSLGEAMTKLENEFGCKLMIRSKKGVEFTEAGKIAVQWANIILKNYRDMKNDILYADEVTQYNETVSGQLRIGGSVVSNNTLLPQLISDLISQYPQINVKITDMTPDDIFQAIMDRTIDLGIINLLNVNDETYSEERKHILMENKFLVQEFYQEPIILLTNKDYAIAKEKTISVKNLEFLPIVLFQEECIGMIGLKKVLQQFGNFNIVLNTNNFGVFKQAIVDGCGVGICIRSSFRKMLDEDIVKSGQVKTLDVKEKIKVKYYLIEQPEKEENQAAKNIFKNRLQHLFMT